MLSKWWLCLWRTIANQILLSNEVRLHVFANRVHTLYSKGRGKLRNLIVVGPSNCGKNFLLFPREIIFKTFLDPANEKYGCVGATTVELIVLNCFCCSNELNKWNYFLLLLEGHAVHLPTQKNHSTSDICIDKDRHFLSLVKTWLSSFTNTISWMILKMIWWQ